MSEEIPEEINESPIYDIPEEVIKAGKEVIDKWLEWKKLDDMNKNHPDRWYIGVNLDGETFMLDMLGWPHMIERDAKRNGLKRKEIEEIMETQKKFAAMKAQKGVAKRMWAKMLHGSTQYSKSILDIEKAKILDLFAKHHNVSEVLQIITQQWGYHTDEKTVRKFRVDNEVLINQKKAEYIARNRDFKLATETGRMEEMSELYWTFKQKFEATPKPEYLRELRALLDSFRKEVKGDEIKLTIDGRIDINATIHANKSVMELARKIPIHMLVVGLVAARQNIDPTQIMASLASSYYAKLNGFNGNTNKEDQMQILYPSSIIKQYDWGEIQRIADVNDEGLKQLSQGLEYTDAFVQEQAKKRKASVQDVMDKWRKVGKLNKEERDKMMGK
jgi:hypothetical protein